MVRVSSSSWVNSGAPSRLASVDMAHLLPAVTDGRPQEGAHRQQTEFGHPQGPGVALEVAHAHRGRQPAEVSEELVSLRHLRQPLVFFRSGTGAEEGVFVSGIVDGGDDAVVGVGEGTGAVEDLLEDVVQVQVEALVDEEAGLAEAGETVPQGGDVRLVLVGRRQG